MRKSRYSKLIYLQIFALIFGVLFLCFLVYKVGFESIYSTISKIGWGFLVILVLNGARHFIRAYCLYLAVPKHLRTFKYQSVLAVRLSGESVSFMTFAGPFLGESTKAALLRKFMPLSNSGAAVIIDNLLYYLSVLLIMIVGSIAMALKYANSEQINSALLLISALGILSIIGLFLAAYFRIKPISFLIRKAEQRSLSPKFVSSKRDWIEQLETNVHDTFENRRGTFLAIFGLIWVAHFLSIFEVFAALTFLGYSPTFLSAFIIEALTKVINFAFSFVPGTVGVYEGGNALILRALGYSAAVGIALAFVRRGAIIFWTVVGAAILAWTGVLKTSKSISRR
ncbi:MAG: lysylphosphatidylglycerol synthase domain-containing protein [Pyrinomonadaceae bacterium]